ncbi:MAG TPA: hypothetical protein VM659_03000 [Dongiaceae bacterium]|nr:hypothetical protein [Dongiaceae bacterium]
MNMIETQTRDDRLTAEDLAEMAFAYPMSLAGPAMEEEAYLDDSRPASAVPLAQGDIAPKVKAELATSLHFILSQYLRPSTLRRLIGPREGMIGRVMLGRSMQGEIDDDLLARVLAQAVVEHIRQSGFVVARRTAPGEVASLVSDDVPF